jgi:hypothetical protein
MERHGPDVVTRLLCWSGATSKARGVMTGSYGQGAKLTDVIQDAAKAWPLYLEIDESQFNGKDVFPTGFTAHGDPKSILFDLSGMFDFEFHEEQGSLVITRPDKGRSTTVFEINQFEGMVGMPEVNRGPQGLGVNVTTRINPFIRTSSRINIKSEFSTYNTGNMQVAATEGDVSGNGEFNVLSMEYVGDTHGDIWDLRIDALRAGTRELANTSNGGGMVWGGKVDQDFRAKVRDIAKRQNLNPDWYMAVMGFETGYTFSPTEKNKAGSGATGLIQFIPSTAQRLGTSTQALSNMTAVQQLDYVEKYFQPYVGRIHNLGDMYMAVFMPAKGIGKPDSTVLIDQATDPVAYSQNASLDANHDGKITRGECVAVVNKSFKLGQANMG